MGNKDEQGLIGITARFLLGQSKKVKMSASQLDSSGLKKVCKEEINENSIDETILSVNVNRITRATPKNPASSISHLCVGLEIYDLSSTEISAIFSFIDLAGSEPTRSEEIDHIVAEEGIWINQSLLEFGSFARDKSGPQNSQSFRSSAIAHNFKDNLKNSDLALLFTIKADGNLLAETKSTLSKIQDFITV